MPVRTGKRRRVTRVVSGGDVRSRHNGPSLTAFPFGCSTSPYETDETGSLL